MKRTFLIFMLFCFISGQIHAQLSITGVVRNNEGETLPGVNVVIKGTMQGSITDLDGKYVIENVPADGVLVFSFVGMQEQEVKVESHTKIDVVLAEDVQSLEEVVIVGYGSVKRANLAGSVSDISAKELIDIPSVNLSSALEGRLAGVRINIASGKPGAATSLQIRESSSFGLVAEPPIFVIDGIIRDKEAFDILDPSEVESISVLKDASAAVYGVKAAGGVVLVKTKKGREGAIKVNYSSSIGITEPINVTEMLSAYEHAVMLNDGFKVKDQKGEMFSESELAYIMDSLPGGGYDWLDGAWKNATVSRHNLNFSGGTEKVRYFFGGSYLHETGNIERVYIRKYTIRSSVEVEVLKGLTAAFEVSLGNKADGSPESPWDSEGDLLEETFRQLLQNPKWIPPTIDGNPVVVEKFVEKNPYSIWASGSYNNGESNSTGFIASLRYEIPFVRGLSAKVQFSQNRTTGYGKIYQPRIYAINYLISGNIIKEDPELDPEQPVIAVWPVESLEESTERSYSYQVNTNISYNRQFGKHEISALFVTEVGESSGNRVGWVRENEQIASGYDLYWAFNEGNDRLLATNVSDYGSLGYVGRLNYNYGSKYIGEFAFRYESSTKFAPDERWGFFPSVLVGWVVSEENFFKNNISFINFLKIRASAGLLGNDAIGSFTWRLIYGPVTERFFLFGDQPVITVDPKNAAFVNPDVSWQKTRFFNGGIDLRFLENKISFTADAFYKYTYDIMASIATRVPTTLGVPANSKVGFNYGIMHAYGYELELGYRNRLPFGIEYSIRGNFAYAEAMKLKVAQSPGAIGTWHDELKNSVDNQPGAISSGIVRDQQEMDDILMDNPNYLNNTTKLETGMLNYKDIRGTDGSEGPNGVFNFDMEEDRTVVARKTSPPFIYGTTLGISWKGIRTDMTFSGRFGHEVLYDKESMTSPKKKENVPAFWADHWTPENPEAAYPRAADYGLSGNYSTFWKRNGHTLRLTDLNVSYALPSAWAQKLGIDQFRIFFNTKYLWTILNPFDYKDVNLSRYNGYPMTRTYNIGVNVNF
ncbi:MAG: TonB-dependent receptor [Bacteroidales bacterium]|nr:TonB-dependent receptor [Bacteroidales bacterium]